MPPKDWNYLVTCHCGTFYTNTNEPTKCYECGVQTIYKPVTPPVTDKSSILKGRIVAFDERTWWGEVCYDLTTLPFHGTSYRGLTNDNLPKIGDLATIILNREGKLLSVEHRKMEETITDTQTKPRKMKVTVELGLAPYGPSAQEVKSRIEQAFHGLSGIYLEVTTKELICNCGDDDWPSYCEYHSKRYGY